MTQSQLECAVAAATGEALPTIRRLGFTTSSHEPQDTRPDDLCLVLDCPFCGRPAAYPGPAALAECPRCDVEFEFSPAEVHVADRGGRTRVLS